MWKARGVVTPEDWFRTCSRCGRAGRAHFGVGDVLTCVRFDAEALPVFWTVHEKWGDEPIRTREGHLVLIKASSYTDASKAAVHYLTKAVLVQSADLESMLTSLVRDPRAVVVKVT